MERTFHGARIFGYVEPPSVQSILPQREFQKLQICIRNFVTFRMYGLQGTDRAENSRQIGLEVDPMASDRNKRFTAQLHSRTLTVGKVLLKLWNCLYRQCEVFVSIFIVHSAVTEINRNPSGLWEDSNYSQVCKPSTRPCKNHKDESV